VRVLQLQDALDDPGEYCCEQMRYQMVGTCRGAENHTTGTEQCPKQMVTYDADLTEYCISPVGLYSYQIQFCPWCGHKLPESKR
jgi:uncharacterized protein DUF6980